MSGKNPVRSIIALFGGQNAAARHLGCRQSVIFRWCQNGRVPSDRIGDVIAAALKLHPPVHLRPDHFFGHADVPAPADGIKTPRSGQPPMQQSDSVTAHSEAA